MEIRLIVFAVLISQLLAPVGAFGTPARLPGPRAAWSIPSCNGKYKGGLKPSPDELADILKKNEEETKTLGRWWWLDNPSRTNLCEADLGGANLIRANLSGVDLSGVNFMGAHLTGANLSGSNLSHAQLPGVDLSAANLSIANLTGANLSNANLTGAHLVGANLSGVGFTRANLAGAQLGLAKLKGAGLSFAHLEGAVFDVLPDSLPDPIGLSFAEGLESVKFSWSPVGLVKLRNQFRDLGLRTQERQLTCAIRRSELRRTRWVFSGLFDPPRSVPLHGRVEQWMNYVFFDLTCQYGTSAERPLISVGVLFILFSMIYVFAQMFPGQRGGIWVVWEENRIARTEGGDVPQRLTEGFPSSRPQGRLRRFLNIASLAAYFSLLSALRTGWSWLNFSSWITRMQPREYSLHATGWVRLFSGLQSLISVYLVALAILTYFGMPFEYY